MLQERDAARLIEAAFPELAPTEARALGSGLDNAAFLVGGSWVFRFPIRPEGVVFLENEICVAPALAPLLPLPIAAPCLIARETRYPYPFAGHRYIAGMTAELATDRAQITAALASFLRALHESEPVIEGEPPGDVMGKTELVRRVEHIRRWMEGHPDAHSAIALAEQLAQAEPARSLTWVHGDLYARHLVLGEDGALAGVIDWGDVHLGDPALDLSIAVGWLEEDAFFERYGEVDRATLDRARFRALTYGVYFITQSGDPSLVALGESYLDRLLTRRARDGASRPPR